MTRRSALAALAAVPYAAALARNATDERPVALTRAGAVRGRTDTVGGRPVLSFKGIRYGAPTGDVRFRGPRPPERRAGIADADSYGNEAPQLAIGLNGAPILAGMAIVRPQSEDCLFLNVWTPSLGAEAARPVMVWLHGGGFVAGSGASVPTDGTRLAARQDVVVVSVNHRLGLFGFLALPDSAGLPDAGNAGMLDLALALEWVRDNIARFGGDPGNVTIFGESGGGCKVSALLAMPAARGLFHKAIVQSGSLIHAHTRETARPLTDAVLAALGLDSKDAARLAERPLAEITPHLPALARTVGWRLGPVIDGRNLPRHPFDPHAPALAHDVPMLIGANRDEATLIVGALDPAAFALAESDLEPRIARLFPGDDAAALVRGLSEALPGASVSERYFTAASWRSVRRNALIQTERQSARGGAPVYSYLLAYRTPADGGRWGATHALDLPLVFDNVAASTAMLGNDGAAQSVADAMSAAWAAFARTGSPGWPAYDSEARLTMVFDRDSRVHSDPDALQRQLLGGPPVNILAPAT